MEETHAYFIDHRDVVGDARDTVHVCDTGDARKKRDVGKPFGGCVRVSRSGPKKQIQRQVAVFYLGTLAQRTLSRTPQRQRGAAFFPQGIEGHAHDRQRDDLSSKRDVYLHGKNQRQAVSLQKNNEGGQRGRKGAQHNQADANIRQQDEGFGPIRLRASQWV
jgi:hypothetical protein